MTRGSSYIAMRLLIATATRASDPERAEPEDPTPTPLPAIPPLPPVAVCSGCGVALGRYHYTETGADPSRKCLRCIEAPPGLERMAAKRARRAKRTGANHHGHEA
jgi:hypothetical protein